MKMIYSPKDGDPQVFNLGDVTDLGEDMTTEEAEAVEDAGVGQWRTFGAWQNLLGEGGFRAWRVMLWILLRRQDPGLDLEEVRPRVSELAYDFGDPDAEGKDQPESAEPADSSTASESPTPASAA